MSKKKTFKSLLFGLAALAATATAARGENPQITALTEADAKQMLELVARQWREEGQPINDASDLLPIPPKNNEEKVVRLLNMVSRGTRPGSYVLNTQTITGIDEVVLLEYLIEQCGWEVELHPKVSILLRTFATLHEFGHHSIGDHKSLSAFAATLSEKIFQRHPELNAGTLQEEDFKRVGSFVDYANEVMSDIAASIYLLNQFEAHPLAFDLIERWTNFRLIGTAQKDYIHDSVALLTKLITERPAQYFVAGQKITGPQAARLAQEYIFANTDILLAGKIGTELTQAARPPAPTRDDVLIAQRRFCSYAKTGPVDLKSLSID